MLIIDGNAVYEIDCDCARRRGLFQKQLSHKEAEPPVCAGTGKTIVRRETYTGAGVTVAILDTGIFSRHRDFGNRIIGWYDAAAHRRTPDDWNGHGTQEAVTKPAYRYPSLHML